MKKQLLLISLGLGCVANGWAADTTTLEQITVEDSALTEPAFSTAKETVATNTPTVPADTITEALKNTFYVENLQSSAYSAEPYIRGRGTKGVPIYLEGMRLNAGHNDSTNLLSMVDIGAVDIYRGANGAQLGMGAMSGAVVAKFNEPIFGNSSAPKASGFWESKGAMLRESGISSSAGGEMFNDRLNISLSGNLSDVANYDDGDGKEILHSGYTMQSYNGSTAVKVNDDSYVYARYMKVQANSEDPFSRYQSSGYWMYTDRPNDEGEYYFFGYRDASLGGFKDVDFQVYGNDLHYDNNTKREVEPSNTTELFRDSETHGAKLSAKKALDNNLLSMAGGYSKMDISNGVRQYNKTTKTWGSWTSAYGITGGDITSASLNLADDITWGQSFFTLASGYEHVGRNVDSNVNTKAFASMIPKALLSQVQQVDTHEDDDLLSFGLTAGYKFCPAFIPYVKFSSATRTPYFNEAYGNSPSNGSQIPNQTLDNETVWGVDVGFDGKAGNLYYTSAMYYQKYHDYIELADTGYKTTAGLPIKQFINLDDANIYGLEALMGYHLDNDRFVEASYLYTRGENETYNQPLAYIAPQKLTLTIGQRRDLGFNWRIQEVLVDEQNRVSTVNGEVPTPGYALTNVAVSYIFGAFQWAKKTTLALEANNLLDQDYREHLDKVSTTAWYLPDNPGINGLLSLRVDF